jgi:hypothetical protein
VCKVFYTLYLYLNNCVITFENCVFNTANGKLSTCANCSQRFKKKAGDTSYYRFSIENVLPSTGEPARLQLQTILRQPVTPVTKKLHGQFLTPQCWNKTNAAGKYYKACKEFLTQTSEQSYLSTKRSRSETLSPSSSFKRPSTPLQVS